MDNSNVILNEHDYGLTAFYNRIYAIMSLGILTSAAVAFIMIRFFALNILMILSQNQFVILALFLVLPLFLVGSVQRAAMKNSAVSLPLFFGYAAFMGFLMSIISLMYTMQSIAIAFVVAASMFIVLSIYGRVTKRDLSAVGKAMLAAVWGLIIASIINLFMGSQLILYIISYASVVIFSILIAWDNQMIKNVYEKNRGQVQEGWAVAMALALYISFLNLFLSLLRIFGGNSRR